MPTRLPQKTSYLIGLISDTHGRFPDKVLELFHGVDGILHAGDIGSADILFALEALAPVVAVRGNMDRGAWAERLPTREVLDAGAAEIHLVHDGLNLGVLPLENGKALAVISGHTHRARVACENGILYVNPGSAGDARYGERPSIALLKITGRRLAAELVRLNE
jgi:hypothetical protein